MAFNFRWIAWNIGKVEAHGCTPVEVERVVNRPARGFPAFVIHAMPLVSRRRRGGR